MAINVYLTLFRKYNAQQLKALEWKYHLMAYGAPFVIAFVFLFAETKERGKIYGPAVVREPAQAKARIEANKRMLAVVLVIQRLGLFAHRRVLRPSMVRRK